MPLLAVVLSLTVATLDVHTPPARRMPPSLLSTILPMSLKARLLRTRREGRSCARFAHPYSRSPASSRGSFPCMSRPKTKSLEEDSRARYPQTHAPRRPHCLPSTVVRKYCWNQYHINQTRCRPLESPSKPLEEAHISPCVCVKSPIFTGRTLHLNCLPFSWTPRNFDM